MRSRTAEQLAAFSPRPVCSDAERRAAVWAHDDLRARGHEAWMETHWVRPWRAVTLAVGCALAALGGLVATGAAVPGLVMAAAGALSVLIDAAGRAAPLRLLLPRRATQVVLVVPQSGAGGAPGPSAGGERAVTGGAPGPSAGGERAATGGAPGPPAGDERAARVDLLIVARTDVPRRGLVRRRLEHVPGGLWWLGLCAAAVTAAAAARVAGADGTLLGAAQLAPTVVLLLAVGGALDTAIAPVGDGRAEDAALAAALALHHELAADPPPGLAPGVLLAGPDSLRAHLRRERLRPDRTALLHVREGADRSRHPQWRAAAAAAGLPIVKRGPRGLPAAFATPEHAERLARALAREL